MQDIRDSLIDLNRTRQMKVVKREPYMIMGSNTAVFGRKIIFNVPKEYNGLSQIYIKSALTCTGAANPMPFLGCRVFDQIIVRTKRGTILFVQGPQFCQSELDSLGNTPLRQQLEKATTPDGNWASNTITVITPVFAWFSSPNKQLPSRHLEDLEIECTVAADYNKMGIDNVSLTAGVFEVYFKFYDDVEPKPLTAGKVVGFDTFVETPVSNASGATNSTCYLTCPFPVINTSVGVINDNQALYEINRIVVTSKGSELIDVDRRMLYSLASKKEISIEDGGFSQLYWGLEHDKNNVSDYMIFNKSMYPCALTATYSQPIAAPSTMYVIHTYAQTFEYLSNGTIIKHLMNEYEGVKFSDTA